MCVCVCVCDVLCDSVLCGWVVGVRLCMCVYMGVFLPVCAYLCGCLIKSMFMCMCECLFVPPPGDGKTVNITKPNDPGIKPFIL